MSTQATLTVSCDPNHILDYVYKTLLSFDKPKSARNAFFNTDSMMAYARINFVPKTFIMYELSCVVTVNDTFNNKYNVNIIADLAGSSVDKTDGITIDFIAEFISRFNNCLSAPSAADPAAELCRFKSMLEEGLITQDDFDAKKKQLLGL